jgi:hypothetical protein
VSLTCPHCGAERTADEDDFCGACLAFISEPTRKTIEWVGKSIWVTHEAVGIFPDGTRFCVSFRTTGDAGGSSWSARVVRLRDGVYRKIDGVKGGVTRARKELAELLRDMADHPNEAWLGACRLLGGQFP